MASEVKFAEEIGEPISFKINDIKERVQVVDHIERCQCQIEVSKPVSPIDIPTEEFHFPVDRGVKITTGMISIPHSVAAYIRNYSGLLIAELTEGEYRELPYDQYSIELSAPVKFYLMIESEFEIEVRSEEIILDFDMPTEVHIGVRSYHERPEATITTTDDPDEMMKAVSYFSSALKTTSCERSYPTLRGHPPGIELSDYFHIPSVLEKPETGITIEVPEEYEYLYIVAPLAYYFGADIVPGEIPKIYTKDGFGYDLNNTTRGFEDEVERVLKQCFFLDCITRTEGYYPVKLYEREQVEQQTALDFTSLYDQALFKQIEEYLTVPYKIIKPHLPQWKQTAYVESEPHNINMLPFVIHDLSIIRSAKELKTNSSNSSIPEKKNSDSTEIDEFTRSNLKNRFIRNYSKSGIAYQTRGDEILDSEEYIQIQETDSLEQTWIGEGIPVGASKAVVEAFRHRFERTPSNDDININVVINDLDMIEEGDVADEIYDSRDKLSFTVDVHQQVKTIDLVDILQKDTDFLHYIGHIDHDGFECVDGHLNIKEINNIGVDAFFLNACSSYQQALELIKSGAIAGIATIQPVLNSGAQRIGKAIARLLNLGFPLISALQIAKSESIVGENYVVVGDGGLDLAQAKSGVPSMCVVAGSERKELTMDYITYPTRRKNIGSITVPYVNENQTHFLTSGSTGKFELDKNEFLRFIHGEKTPIKINSELYWADEISTEQLSFD